MSWESFTCILYENVSLNHSSIRAGLRTIQYPHPPSGQDQESVPLSSDELFTKRQPVRVSLKAVLNSRPHPTSHHTPGNCRHSVCGRCYRTIPSFKSLIQGLYTEREAIRLVDPAGPPQVNPSLLIYSVILSREKHLLRPLCLAPGDTQCTGRPLRFLHCVTASSRFGSPISNLRIGLPALQYCGEN